MKYIYFGTPEFSTIILEKLIGANFIPVAVVTNPDRPFGRKKIITPPPVKVGIKNLPASPRLVEAGELRIRNKIQIVQPEKLDQDLIRQLKNLQPEFAILAAYGKIIPQEIIDIFPKGIIVVHPSLLPKYRGATPIQNALLNDEKETGTTLILMDEKVDHGAILGNQELGIRNQDNYETLVKKLAEISADLLVKTLPKYLSGKIKPQPQNERLATYTKKFSSEDGQVDLQNDDLKKIWLKIRALNPEPGVWTIIKNPADAKALAGRQELGIRNQGKRMKILEADFQNGKLILKKIQIEGEKPKNI